MLCIPQAFGQDVPGEPRGDAFDELIEWAQEWNDVDAMDVTWHRTNNLYDGSADGRIIKSFLYTERTVYRWPDSWKRVVERDDIPGNEDEYLKRLDESNVVEGIQPDGSHARRMLDLPQGELMNGPKLVDSLPKEVARAPFLLARWLVDEGLERKDLNVQWTGEGSIDGICLSAGLGFVLSPYKDGGYYLSHTTMLSHDGLHLVEYALNDPVWPDGIPNAIASKVRVTIRQANGNQTPAPSLDLLKAQAVPRPPDEAMYVNFKNVTIQDRRTDMTILPNKQQIKTQPVVTPRRMPSLTHILRYGGIVAVLAAAGWWWFRRRAQL